MMLKKQTVWLLTMLAVMVVLSGYYLVKGPGEQVPQTTTNLTGVEVITEEDQGLDEAALNDQTDTQATSDENSGEAVKEEETSEVLGDVSVFEGLRYKQEEELMKEIDEQRAISMDNENHTPQEQADAKAKMEELEGLRNAIKKFEEHMKLKGYTDAVATVNQSNNTTSVNVIVKKDGLDAKEAVAIIALAKQHFNVPGNQITVEFQK
jgi:stage III sporulation protein AH